LGNKHNLQLNEINLKNKPVKETRKIIRNLIAKEMKGVYIISENKNEEDVIYVGQSVTCIRERILIHLNAVEDKKSAHKSYRKFFKDYLESDLHITILPITHPTEIDDKELKLLHKYKEALLTYKYKPKFVFER
jgi:L-fucose isomerase-like protein